MGQLLRYSLVPPDLDPRVDLDKFMVTTFVDAVRNCLKAGGFSTKSNEAESGGTFLVGFRGNLFEFGDDYQVGRPSEGFAAVGGGAMVALGAMHATEDMPPLKRLAIALGAAERFASGVRSPFSFVSEE